MEERSGLVTAAGRTARTTLSQRFRNDERAPIECVYKFPLPESAAVCGFRAACGDRVVTGEVEEREAAFARYDDALAAGDGAMLLDEERPNVFTLSVGNVEPGAECVVSLDWVAPLETRGNEDRLVIPATITPRHVPPSMPDEAGRPAADAVTPPYALEVPYGLVVEVAVEGRESVRALVSPSHPIRTGFDGDRALVTFASGEAAMDRDFVLAIERAAEAGAEPPHGEVRTRCREVLRVYPFAGDPSPLDGMMTMATERLFERDAYLREFEATVISSTPTAGGRFEVTLDRTAFYPGGGGQPCDRGRIGDAEVVETREGEGGRVVHVTSAPVAPGPVRASIDWARRFDFMQQHTGQHLLSAGFHELLGGPTVGFHLGETESTIDVELPELSDADVERVERWANAFLFEPRETRVHLTDDAGLDAFRLRKRPRKAFGVIRLVEIPGADLCPCGGTHVRSTGELGLVKIVSRVKRGSEFRLTLLAGGRAFSDYSRRIRAMERAGAALSAPPERLAEAALALREKLDRLDAARKAAETARLDLLAESLASRAPRGGAFRVVAHTLETAETASVTELAAALARRGGIVALAGGVSPDGTKCHLAFAASASVTAEVDMAELLREALPLVEGRGGGTARFAQGGGPRVGGLFAALERAAELARAKAG